MVRMSTPALISMEACACRKLWNVLSGTTRDHALVMLRGRSSSPSTVLNTKCRRSILPRPSTRRSSSCLTLWARSRATAPSPRVILRRPRRVFGGFSLKTGSGLLDGPLDAERATVEIHIAPLKAEQLAAPHAGGEGKLDDRQQGVPSELGANLRDLIGGKDLKLLLLDRGRLANRRHVARNGAVLDGVSQDAHQEAVSVTDRARCQPYLE